MCIGYQCICGEMYFNALCYKKNTFGTGPYHQQQMYFTALHCVAIKYIWHRTIPSSASSPVGRFLCFCRHLKGKLQEAQGPKLGSEVGHISQSLISFPQPSASFNHSLKPGDPKDLRNLFANNSFVHIFPYC